MNNQFVEIMRCSVGSQQFGIVRSKVQSVQHGNRVTVVSAEKDSFEAVIKTSEGDLPVLRLGDFMQQQSTLPLPDQRLLILRSSWGLWCLLVDEVTQAELVATSAIVPLPRVASNSLVGDVLREEGSVLLMLSPDNIHPNAMLSGMRDGQLASGKEPPIAGRSAAPDGKSHLVLFRMPGADSDDASYAIGLTPKQIDEVLRSVKLQPVPTAPDFLDGVITWRGKMVPVMNLGKRLGITEKDANASSGHRRIVVAHGTDPNKLIAFYAEPDVEILRLPAPHRPIADVGIIDRDLVHGAAEYAGQTVMIPHISNLAVVA